MYDDTCGVEDAAQSWTHAALELDLRAGDEIAGLESGGYFFARAGEGDAGRLGDEIVPVPRSECPQAVVREQLVHRGQFAQGVLAAHQRKIILTVPIDIVRFP